MLGMAPKDAETPQVDPLATATGVLVGVIALMVTCRHVVGILLEKAEAEADAVVEGDGGSAAKASNIADELKKD